MATRIEVCDAALGKIGNRPLQSETAPGAGPVLRLHDQTLDTLLALKPWSFGRRTAELPRRGVTPAGGWTYAFQMPVDRTGPPHAVFETATDIPDDPLKRFELAGDDLLVDVATCWIVYPVTPLYAARPPLFVECHRLLLAAELALALRNDQDLRRQLRNEVLGDPRVPGASGLLYQAAAQDVQAQPSRRMIPPGGPLIDVRRAGRVAWPGRR